MLFANRAKSASHAKKSDLLIVKAEGQLQPEQVSGEGDGEECAHLEPERRRGDR